MIYILGIESTCDETAAAIINDKNEIISHVIISQAKDHAEYGGVVPEIASRKHLENIKSLMNLVFKDSKDPETGAQITINEIDYIACATKPGLIGGLLVGINFSKAICSALKKPFIPINHLDAHLLMPFMFEKINFPNLAVLISGGHCQIFFMENFYNFKKIGETLDDSIGETFDKVALMLGLQYPGGPEIEKYAKAGNQNKYRLPMPLTSSKYDKEHGCDFSFSGLKTACRLLIEKLKNENENHISDQMKSDICASFQFTIVMVLIHKISASLNKYPEINEIVISGGVAANQYLRTELLNFFKNKIIYFPPLNLCTDNGVMIAHAGLIEILKNK